MKKFEVIDTKTGKKADPMQIALNENWAKDLVYCDMEGFFVGENGEIILADECGQYVYCDPIRFKVIWQRQGREGEGE
ncbi:MAG: hypothetical protein QME45_04240 [Clostridiales bacterium]|nr:hypothetical protein [Clostridiales bacterium]